MIRKSTVQSSQSSQGSASLYLFYIFLNRESRRMYEAILCKSQLFCIKIIRISILDQGDLMHCPYLPVTLSPHFHINQ